MTTINYTGRQWKSTSMVRPRVVGSSSVRQEKSRVWARQRAARAQLHSLRWLFILNRKHLLDNGLALRLQMNYGHPFTTWRLVINFDINFPVSTGL